MKEAEELFDLIQLTDQNIYKPTQVYNLNRKRETLFHPLSPGFLLGLRRHQHCDVTF